MLVEVHVPVNASDHSNEDGDDFENCVDGKQVIETHRRAAESEIHTNAFFIVSVIPRIRPDHVGSERVTHDDVRAEQQPNWRSHGQNRIHLVPVGYATAQVITVFLGDPSVLASSTDSGQKNDSKLEYVIRDDISIGLIALEKWDQSQNKRS